MNTESIFLSKLYQGNALHTKEAVASKMNDENTMFSMTIDLKTENYEWGKGWLNGCTNEDYHKEIKDFVNQVGFLESLSKTEIGFTDKEWDFPERLNGKAYIYPHPMSWNLIIPANKVNDFISVFTSIYPNKKITHIRVHNIYETLELKENTATVEFVNKIIENKFKKELNVMVENDRCFKVRKWNTLSNIELEYFWFESTTFQKVTRMLSDKEDAALLAFIKNTLVPLSAKVYEEKFMTLPFFTYQKNNDGDTMFRLKTHKQRTGMSIKNKELAESFDVII